MKRYAVKLLHMFILSSIIIQVQCQNIPHKVFNRQAVKEHLISSDSFYPIPQAKDSFWQQTIPHEMRSDYINLGLSYKGARWEQISDSVFSEFHIIGNRVNYERLSFALRRQMACLVIAEIMENKGHFLEDILNGLDYFIQEIWWGIPAHYPTPKPDSGNQIVDLFNAETANMLAWTIYMLHDELEKAKPGICDIIKKEIDRRMLIPVRTESYSWKTKVDNWNTWICANWLSCILLCETNRERQINDIEKVLTCLEVFYEGYPNDGGCDEGVYYWGRAAASLYESVRLLNLATNGHFSFSNDSKFKSMGSFVYKAYIGNNSYVNFADTPSNAIVDINILFPYGNYIEDSLMIGFAAMIANKYNYNHHPSKLYLSAGNYPVLSRELLFLSVFSEFADCKPKEPLIRDTWLPELQFFTARSLANSTDGLFVAAKGGHNAEKHNHNDIGSFIIYSGTNPLLIDLGFATYTAETFSSSRYELTNCRSAYHNVPLINGCEQQEGKAFCAKNVEYSQNSQCAIFSLNIEDAYPKEAEIKKWHRTIKLNRGKNIVITEDFDLKKFMGRSEIILICYGKPFVEKEGRLAIQSDANTHYIVFNSKQLSPVVEKIPTGDIGFWRNRQVYRVRLIFNDNKLNGKIKYIIQ